MVSVSPHIIYEIGSGFMRAQHLFVAAEIGVFEQLVDGPATLEELVQRTHTPARGLRIILNAVLAMGLLEHSAGRYRNGPVAASYLGGVHSQDLRAFLRYWARISYPLWMKLEASVRSGEGSFRPAPDQENLDLLFEATQAIAPENAEAIAAVYDFTSCRSVVHVGADNAVHLRTILSRHPQVKGCLFSDADVVRRVRSYAREGSVESRIQLRSGDPFQDRLPGGHDLVLLTNVLQRYGPELSVELLHRLRDASSAGCRLLLSNVWTDASQTQPEFAAIMAGELLITTESGGVVPEPEVRTWLQDAGWQFLERRTLVGPPSLIVAEAE